MFSSRRPLYPGFLLSLTLLIIASLPLSAAESLTLTVQTIEGKAQVQRSGRHSWEKLSTGRRLSDNDLIETDFNSRLTLKLSDGGSAIIGSDSRTLIAIVKKSRTGGEEAGFSLLSGGILLGAIGHPLAVYTGNAVGEIDSGVLAVMIETEGRRTGLLNLGGEALIRGIMQQKSRKLSPGRASFVIPGRDPVFHIPISYRHVAALKRLFGDDCIEKQLQASNIIPLDDKQADNSLALSLQESNDSLGTGRQFYERLFSLNKIWGSILSDRSIVERPYTPVLRPSTPSDSALSVGLTGDIGHFNTTARTYAELVPCWKNDRIEAALRLSIAQNTADQKITGLNSTAGILDKLEHLTVGSVADSLYFTAGTLYDLTLGNGLMVNHFRNDDNNSIFHPLGIAGEARYSNLLDIKGFLADVTDPSLGGVYVKSCPSIYTFGAGYYFDGNPYRRPPSDSGLRYTNPWPPSRTVVDTAKGQAGVGTYEITLGANGICYYGFQSKVLLDFAQDRFGGIDNGDLYKIPDIELNWPGIALSFGFMLEKGTIVSDEFDEFYYSRRSFFRGDTLLTENTSLTGKRLARTLYINYAANLGTGIDFSAGYSQVLGPDSAIKVLTTVANAGSNEPVYSPDYSFHLRLSLDDRAVSFIKYASVYACQNHAGLFPPSGAFLDTWNSEAGFDFMTRPLIQSFSLQGGGRYYHVDNDFSSTGDGYPGKGVWEFSLGAVWGML
jgi:hypothetical protein